MKNLKRKRVGARFKFEFFWFLDRSSILRWCRREKIPECQRMFLKENRLLLEHGFKNCRKMSEEVLRQFIKNIKRSPHPEKLKMKDLIRFWDSAVKYWYGLDDSKWD